VQPPYRAYADGPQDAGVDQMALSLDFPRADLHDTFGGVPGAFARTMAAAEWAHAHALPLQINTTLFARSAPYLPEIAALVERLGIVFWEVFFLVSVGRGTTLGGLTAEQCEELFEIIYQVQKRAPFVVKVTEAPHYRRRLPGTRHVERPAEGAHGGRHLRLRCGLPRGVPRSAQMDLNGGFANVRGSAG
jgi:MoaA/NifB/PqqE/SkfB family radical SAM enzyme